ncbi:MAG: diguanylate cyclase [Gammaproteobacteria bacterium]|nr:diguanylate cyclase [Gammaproteobacteria bacterium]
MADLYNTDNPGETISRLNEENTRLKKRLEELTEGQQIYRFVFDASPDAVAYIDKGLTIKACNTLEAERNGNQTGQRLPEVIGPRQFRQLQPHIDRVLSGEEVALEEYDDQTNEQSQLETYYLPHIGRDRQVLGFCRITRKGNPAQLTADGTFKPSFNHDYLTELPNRILFQDRLNQAIYRAIRGKSKIALLLISVGAPHLGTGQMINNGKDNLYRIIASRLQQCVRRSDTLARVGVNEFVVLVENLSNLLDLQKLSQKLVDLLRQPLRAQGSNLEIRVNIGIGIYPNHGADSSTLLARATDALEQSKRQGAGRYSVYGH